MRKNPLLHKQQKKKRKKKAILQFANVHWDKHLFGHMPCGLMKLKLNHLTIRRKRKPKMVSSGSSEVWGWQPHVVGLFSCRRDLCNSQNKSHHDKTLCGNLEAHHFCQEQWSKTAANLYHKLVEGYPKCITTHTNITALPKKCLFSYSAWLVAG